MGLVVLVICEAIALVVSVIAIVKILARLSDEEDRYVNAQVHRIKAEQELVVMGLEAVKLKTERDDYKQKWEKLHDMVFPSGSSEDSEDEETE
ncbi:hypothetical protein E2P64_06455 [Candidatus Bathyarchaeota archaeon]|nr:hypothetical protein E2P64_06455 [Candidatus Bathyarchaeota archaeon]